MNSTEPYRRYVLVDCREESPGIRRLRLARVTGVVPLVSCAPDEPMKSAQRS